MFRASGPSCWAEVSIIARPLAHARTRAPRHPGVVRLACLESCAAPSRLAVCLNLCVVPVANFLRVFT
ncbi:unnamed protein product [Mesocestoides corti]|uniref:Uncharacterized protein n=1 Tax=Mesocestoides corti TaxID=53468 RepID=A0A0R3UPC1_MESCO|nr:unnamed protein product [Mesocestoides corti]